MSSCPPPQHVEQRSEHGQGKDSVDEGSDDGNQADQKENYESQKNSFPTGRRDGSGGASESKASEYHSRENHRDHAEGEIDECPQQTQWKSDHGEGQCTQKNRRQDENQKSDQEVVSEFADGMANQDLRGRAQQRERQHDGDE